MRLPQDRLDAGEDVPTTDYIKAVGKYEGSRLNPDGNEEYKKANPRMLSTTMRCLRKKREFITSMSK